MINVPYRHRLPCSGVVVLDYRSLWPKESSLMSTEALKLVGTHRNGKPIVIRRETDPRILQMRRELNRYALRRVAEQWLKEIR